MTEIKFRTWNPREKIIEPFVDIKNGEPYYKGVRWVGGIVMQYIGIKDKNGKEVYEGDIVKTHFENKNFEVIKTFSGWGLKINKSLTRYFDPREELEIIGNIYENPELLCRK